MASSSTFRYVSLFLLLGMFGLTHLAVAHVLTEDDEYNGMFIPKGSTILANST